MKKIIILTLAFCAIALLPQVASAQTQTAPKEEKVIKEVKPVVGKVNVKDGKPVKPVVPAKKEEAKELPAGTKIVDFKPATGDKEPVKLIVKPLKGPNKKIVKPTNSQKKNPKQ